ncbi:MAG: lasso peptide biosynthesis B2 protein [Sphingomonas sp.]
MGFSAMLAGARIAAALGLTAALIGALGLRRAARIACWTTDRLPAPRASPLAPAAIAEAQAMAIARVARSMVPQPRCLSRALLLAAGLRRHRIAAELCLGAQVGDAFDAHAWVELGGEPVRESADLKMRYRCLWRLPARAR